MNRFFVGTKIDGGETRMSYPMSPANLAGAPGAFQGLHGVRVAKLGGFRGLHGVRIAKLGGFQGLHGVWVAKPGGFRALHSVRIAKPGGFQGLHGVRVAKPGGFRALHSVRVANSGELFYVACKLGRRPWRLSGLARRANSKTRVGLFPHVWSSSSPSSLTFNH